MGWLVGVLLSSGQKWENHAALKPDRTPRFKGYGNDRTRNSHAKLDKNSFKILLTPVTNGHALEKEKKIVLNINKATSEFSMYLSICKFSPTNKSLARVSALKKPREKHASQVRQRHAPHLVDPLVASCGSRKTMNTLRLQIRTITVQGGAGTILQA